MPPLEEQMLAFARSKPADERYSYISSRRCALFQMLKANGHPVKDVGGFTWGDTSGDRHRIPEALGTALVREPYTFGGLVERLTA